MTKAGIERKATCRALFSKLLYLAESEELAPSLDAPKRRPLVQVRMVSSARRVTPDPSSVISSDAPKATLRSTNENQKQPVKRLSAAPPTYAPVGNGVYQPGDGLCGKQVNQCFRAGSFRMVLSRHGLQLQASGMRYRTCSVPRTPTASSCAS